MPAELNDLSVAIGALQADVKSLARTVATNQKASTREHRLVHDIVVATSESVRVIAAKVATMEPLTEDYREKRAEARGAARLTHWIYVTGGGIAGAVASKAVDIFTFKPHP